MFCYLCKGDIDLYLDWINPNGEKRYKCRSCNTNQVRRYRNTDKGKAAIYKAIKTYESRTPKKRKTWEKAKKIIKKPCIKCGETNTHRHHPDTNKPLEVKFLCAAHHKEEHKLVI